jgi:hypothetical protein
MKLPECEIRKWYEVTEDALANESGRAADGPPLRKIVVAAVTRNPYSGRYSAKLDKLVKASPALGREFGRRICRLMGRDGVGSGGVQSYGKACIVGASGEYEHGNALITTAFADPVRLAIGGGKAWIPSTGKRGGPGTSIDVPLAHKDALFVRSHYDTATVVFADAPSPDEIVVIFAVASRGRLHARLGGLRADQVKGEDGLH